MKNYLLVLLGLLCLFAWEGSASFTKLISPYQSFCVFKHAQKGDQIYGSYIVSGYDEKSVTFLFFNPYGSLIHMREKQREAKFRVNTTEEGEYKLCFSNPGKSGEVFISFDLYTIGETQKDKMNKISTDQVMDVGTTLDEALNVLKDVRTGLSFQEMRDHVHHMNLGNLASKINWSTFFKVFTLMIVACSQLYLFSKFMSKREQYRV